MTARPATCSGRAPRRPTWIAFEQLVNEAGQAGASGEPGVAAAALRRGTRALAGTAAVRRGARPFAQEAARRLEEQRLEEQRLEALEARVEADLALSRAPELVGELSALVREHPYRERLPGRPHARALPLGAPAEALEAYRAARRALVNELGIDPSPALAQFERAILSHDPTVGLPTPHRRRTSRRRQRSRVLRALSSAPI